MPELQGPQNKPSERKPHAAVVQSTRSRVEGLDHVDMDERERALFDESRILQNGIATQLKNVDRFTRPEITPEMIRVVEIAFELHGQPRPPKNVEDGLSTALIGKPREEEPIFTYGTFFEYYPESQDEMNWVHAFNFMIDNIDPDNSKRFVS